MQILIVHSSFKLPWACPFDPSDLTLFYWFLFLLIWQSRQRYFCPICASHCAESTNYTLSPTNSTSFFHQRTRWTSNSIALRQTVLCQALFLQWPWKQTSEWCHSNKLSVWEDLRPGVSKKTKFHHRVWVACKPVSLYLCKHDRQWNYLPKVCTNSKMLVMPFIQENKHPTI